MPKRTNKVNPLWQWPGKKKSLELEEWWFEDCPKDELQHCWAYELGRHIHEVVWDYYQDKKQKFKYGGSDIRENGIWFGHINLYDSNEEEIPLDQFGIAAPSGFPEKPFLKVDRSKLDKKKYYIPTSVRIFPLTLVKSYKLIMRCGSIGLIQTNGYWLVLRIGWRSVIDPSQRRLRAWHRKELFELT